jgi:hypothetical protein
MKTQCHTIASENSFPTRPIIFVSMMSLLKVLFTLSLVILVIDAGAQVSKPSGGTFKINIKDATLAVSGAAEDSLGAGKA